MDAHAHARRLVRSGLYSDALKVLEGPHQPSHHHSVMQLKAEVLQHVGEFERSRATIRQLLKSHGLTARHRAGIEQTLGTLSLFEGAVDEGIAHMQRASVLAAECGDHERMCW